MIYLCTYIIVMKPSVIYLILVIGYTSSSYSVLEIPHESRTLHVRLRPNLENYFDDSHGFYISSFICNVDFEELKEEEKLNEMICEDMIILVPSISHIYILYQSNKEVLENSAFILYSNETTNSHYMQFEISRPIFELKEAQFEFLKTYLGERVNIVAYSTDANAGLFNYLYVMTFLLILIVAVVFLHLTIQLLCKRQYITQLHKSYLFAILFIFITLLLLLLYTILTRKKLNGDFQAFKTGILLKQVIECFDKIFLPGFLIYLNLIASGWQIVKESNSNTTSDLKNCLILFVCFFFYFLIDLSFQWSKIYLRYFIPIKDIVGFGLLYLIIVHKIKTTLISLRCDEMLASLLNDEIAVQYKQVYYLKRIIYRFFLALLWLYLVIFSFVISGINILGLRQFQTSHKVHIDAVFVVLFYMVFHPRGVNLFNSYYISKSLAKEGYCDFVIKIPKSLDVVPYGNVIYYASNREIEYPTDIAMKMNNYPILIINPHSENFNFQIGILDYEDEYINSEHTIS